MIVIGALAPTVDTTMLPQLVSKVNVRAILRGSFAAGATDRGVCPTAFVGLHFTDENFTGFADFPFGSAKAEGERVTEIARAAITKSFTLTLLGMDKW